MSIFKEICAERLRQVQVEGYTSERDIGYYHNELSRAAWCYWSKALDFDDEISLKEAWPWAWDTFKPTNRHRCFVKAGALYMAELERRWELDIPADEIYSSLVKCANDFEKYLDNKKD